MLLVFDTGPPKEYGDLMSLYIFSPGISHSKNEYTNKCSNNKMKISNAKVNHDIIQKLSYSPEVQGYPTIQFHHKGKNLSEFSQNRTPEELMKFAKGNLKNIPESKKKSKKKSKKRKRSSGRSRNNKNNRSKRRKQ